MLLLHQVLLDVSGTAGDEDGLVGHVAWDEKSQKKETEQGLSEGNGRIFGTGDNMLNGQRVGTV